VKRKSLKIAVAVLLVLLALVAGAYCYISSGHFIKTQVLPRVAKALGTDVEAREAAFSLLSSIELKDLRIGSEADPLLQAGTIRIRYRAWSFFKGAIEVDEVFLDQVRFSATPAKLEALTKSVPPSEEKTGKAAERKTMPELLVRDVKVRDLNVSYAKDGVDPLAVEVSNLSLDLPQLTSGGEFLLTGAAQAEIRAGGRMDAVIKEIRLDLGGILGQDTMPEAVSLDLNIRDVSGTAGPASLDGRRVQVAAELAGAPDSYALKKLSVVEYVGEIKDAALEVDGRLGIQPPSAALDLMVDIPPGSLLNVIGAIAGGLDFGQTAVAYTGHVELTSGQHLATRGALQVSDLTVAASGIPAIRPMQVALNHELAVDVAAKTVTLSQLEAKVSDGSRDVVAVTLDQAMAVDLQNPERDASARISVRVDRLDLTLLNPFLAGRSDLRILRGELNRAITITIGNGGRQIALDVGGGGIDKLLVQQGDQRVGPLRIDHEARLQLVDLNDLHINHFKVDVIPLSAGPEPAATAVLGGEWKTGRQPTGNLTVTLTGNGRKLALLAKPLLDDRTMPYLKPLLAGNAALDMSARLQARLDQGKVELEDGRIQVDGFGQEHLIDVAVDKTAFALEDLKRGDDKVRIPLNMAVNDLNLARLLPFLPAEAGIAKLAGTLRLNGKALLTGPAQGMKLETSASIQNAQFVLKDGTALAAPITPSLTLALDYSAGGIAKLERLNTIVRQAGRQEPLLDLEVTGHFDTSMDPAVRNFIDISTRGPVLLDALGTLVSRPEQSTGPTPQPVSAENGKKPVPPEVWVALSIAVDEAVYGDLRIQNLGAEAEYRNGKVDLSKAEAAVNDGTVAATGMFDFGNPEKPQYDLRITGHDLQFAPVLSTFIPRTAIYTKGGLKEAVVTARGTGFDMASLQNNLLAKVDVTLDQLIIERMSGTVGKLTEALLLGIFNLNWGDLSFKAGGLDLAIDSSRFGDHDIHIQTLLLQAPAFQLNGSGSVQFGGVWAPDMEIKTGFIEAKADSLRRQGYAISTQADSSGYYPGPAIPLKGDLTSLRTQASLVAEVLVRSGKLSPQDAMKADLVNQILGSLGNGSADGQKKKTDVGGLLGGILGGVLESQAPQENQTEKKDDSTEAIGNLLQGIFGH